MNKRSLQQKKMNWFGLSQRFSIRKYHVGAASVLLGTALIFANTTTVHANSTGTDGASTVIAQSANLEEAEIAKEIESLEQEKTELVNEKNAMDQEGVPTHYVTDGTITISDEYANALLEQTEHFAIRAWWDLKDNATYNNQAENNANHAQLTELAAELSTQTYDTSKDTRPVADPTQLTEEQQLELNYFGVDLINQVREQTRQAVSTAIENKTYDDGLEHPVIDVETPKSMFDFAVNVTNDYKGVIEAGWTYDVSTINKYAEQYGMRTESGRQKQEEIKYIGTGNANPKVTQETLDNMTMGQLKGYVYEGIKRYLFEPEFSNNINRRWEKAGSVTGLNSDRRDSWMAAITLSFSQNTNWRSEVVYVPTVHLFLEKYDYEGVPGNFTWTDKDGNGRHRVDGSEDTENDVANRKFDKTLLKNGDPQIAEKYNNLVSRIDEIDKRLDELKNVETVVTEYRKIENGVRELKVSYRNGTKTGEQLVFDHIDSRKEIVEPFKTEYKPNENLEVDAEPIEEKAGKNGLTVTGTKYTVVDGKLVKTDLSSESYNSVTRILQVGTKPTTKTTEVPFATTYQADETLEAGTQSPLTAGVAGEQTVTTTYTLNADGTVTSKDSDAVRTKEPVNAVIKVGTKPTTKTTEVPFATTYQADETLEAGTKSPLTAGVAGEQTVTTTYTLNADGTVTSKDSDAVRTKEPVNAVIKVGTKPTTKTEEVPFETVYENDLTLEAGQTKIKVKGANGIAEVTTSYLLDTVSGQVTPGTSTTVTIKAPVTQIELVGKKVVPVVTTIWRQTATGAEQVEVTSVNGQVTGEKVLDTKVSTRQETTIPFKIELFEDETKVKGSKVLVQKGIDGKQTTGVIYTVVNGELVTTPLNDVVEPVTERIAMGTKPDSQSVQINKPAVNETKKPVVSPAPTANPGNGTVQSAQPLASATQAAAPSQTSKATLPNTGEKETVSMTLGATLLSMALGMVGFKKREN